jgi:hypothetical protein
MHQPGDHEVEETLRSLPTAGPPPHLRERVLRAAAKSRGPRAAWKLGLAYALCLLALLALDIGIDRAQSARLARLVDGRQAITAPAPGAALAYVRDRNAMLMAMGEAGTRTR